MERDVPLPLTEIVRCEAWIRDLALVCTLSIRVPISTCCGIVHQEIHVFCEASPKAYGACAYIIF